jgi:hypothetical protein
MNPPPYDARFNQTNPIQEHKMIVKAVNSPFEGGELVRCREMERSWVGVVVKTTVAGLVVKEFGSNRRQAVPASRAVPFSKFLERLRRARKLKTVYAEFFGGAVFERMPQQRLRALFRLLRAYGIQFDDWRTGANDYFRMWANRAHLVCRKPTRSASASLPEEVAQWLPKWLIAEERPASSRDPLGLQAGAGKLADGLLPGLTVFTSRVGYFFFLPWVVRYVNALLGISAAERRETINRIERALVLCETLHHGEEGLRHCYHQGQRSKTGLLAQAAATASLPDRILKNQNNTGCYNLYRNALLSCGVWCEDDEAGARGLLPYRLSVRGEQMAQVFDRCEGAQALLRWTAGNTRPRPVGELRGWGRSFCFCDLAKGLKQRVQFLEGFIFAQDDAPNVVIDSAVRRKNLDALAAARLLHLRPSEDNASRRAVIADEEMDADGAETADGSENVGVLLYFYTHRSAPGANSFVPAAVYELLGLAVNGIWKGLLDDVPARGRLGVTDWVVSTAGRSSIPDFWRTPLRAAAAKVRATERMLVGRLSEGEAPVQNGLMLAVKVFSRRENHSVLNELASTELQELLSATFELKPDQTVQETLPVLVWQLLERHRIVSERKCKQQWLQGDGHDVWRTEERETPMALGFHSYRMPQLMSLARDLQLERSDLRRA